ncbi:MAG: DUF983 domain-containing protein [Chloroflexi bacterium]|nr:DUF983 domain-containing protein [Chloroflexota bacterium]
MVRIIRVLWLTLFLRCPACQRGHMFRSMFRMNVRCPVCGVIFERDHGEITGGMAINTVMVLSIAIVGAVLSVTTTYPTWLIIGATALVMTSASVLFYRHARALWIGILYLTGSMFEDV